MPPALSAKVVAAIDDLELVARRIVEGMRAGHNRSPFHGFSTEPASIGRTARATTSSISTGSSTVAATASTWFAGKRRTSPR